jgi:hypothetical protein
MASLLTEGWPKSVIFYNACACADPTLKNINGSTTAKMILKFISSP